MKTLLVAGACLLALSGPALACQWSGEFPKVANELQRSTITTERLDQLMAELERGRTMHAESDQTGDSEKFTESLRILDTIKREIPN